MKTHTPTPWQYATNVGPTKALIVERDGCTVMEVRRTVGYAFAANVAFIVRAVNNHDELVAAIRGLLERPSDFLEPHEAAEMISEARAFARAALAKAEA